MSSNSTSPSPGDIVRVRTRTFLVENVEKSPDGHLISAACLDDDAQGQPLQALWEIEPDAEVIGADAWKRIGEKGFDPTRQFAAYIHTLRWNCVT
ncbi:MAG: hypothetical protein O2857_30680, partial [Planctomycetota bacterium]|nr:hypothetical protein [Planctomycetota bacterium]